MGAFGADDAFGSTCRWCTNEPGLTRTNRVAVDFFAVAVRSARGWSARILRFWWDRWFELARTERIAGVAWETVARRSVVDDATLRVYSAGAWTWVFTFVVDAGLGAVTVGVDDALGSTAGVWVAEVLWETGARTGTVAFFADGVGAAW